MADSIFKRLRRVFKRKWWATFNAAEYETERVLKRLNQQDELIGQLQAQLREISESINVLQTKTLSEISYTKEFVSENLRTGFEQQEKTYLNKMSELEMGISSETADFKDAVCKELNAGLEHCDKLSVEKISELEARISSETDNLKEEVCTDIKEALEHQNGISLEKAAELKNDIALSNSNFKQYYDTVKSDFSDLKKLMNILNESIGRSDLNAVVSCRSDDDFDKRMIPMNNYFGNRGMAICMHLTSVQEKPDPIVYETADIIRTSALSLVADEIKARTLGGAVAELGVAQGKFARVINALFPDKLLYLFDTFEGFPEADVKVETANNYSHTSRNHYADIDMNALMKGMRYPDKCIIRKGYFPETAKGLEEERFCFVNIDCDLYAPILAGLEFFYPRLVKGGCIFVHDYRSKYFKGVRHALNEFAEKFCISYCVLPDNTGTAVIMK